MDAERLAIKHRRDERRSLACGERPGDNLCRRERMVRSGENLAPTFMHDFPQPGALPIVVNGQVIGAMGVSGADGEKCAQAAIDALFKGQATSSTR